MPVLSTVQNLALILIFFMWMGRVEIIPVLVLFTSLLRPVRQAIRMKKCH
ncbi:hypothetical protein NIES2100_37620 [Calothrix sp. NIES-2100]|nr:hypothetical protein NIES2100_37620 [Calothrix sp. NIES-2100]